MFPGDIAATNSVLGGGTSVSQGLFMEMFFTSLLVFVVLMLAAEKSQDTFIAPIGIGLALFVAMIAGKPCRVKCRLHQHLLTMDTRNGLHWRITQPGAESWLCCGSEIFPRISLDLLARATSRFAACYWSLSACQDGQLRGRKLRTGRGRRKRVSMKFRSSTARPLDFHRETRQLMTTADGRANTAATTLVYMRDCANWTCLTGRPGRLERSALSCT